MATTLRIATFNLENFDDPGPAGLPTLATRIALMRPQLERLRADVLFLQEVNSQTVNGVRTFAALDQLVAGTPYATFNRAATTVAAGTMPLDVRNLVILTRFPIASHRQIKHEITPRPAYRRVTAIPPDVGSLYDVVRREKRLLLRRDFRYLDWRYVQNPSRADYEIWTARRANGRLCGLLVLKPGSGLAPDSATVADWLASETDTAATDALLHVATRRAAEEKKVRLMAVFPEWSAEWRAFEARGFQKTPSSTWLERRLVYLLTGSPLTADVLQAHWWYALGDSDLA